MSDVTQILQQIERGDPEATEQLLPLVYAELKRLAAAKMACERPDHTPQATALVHEAYFAAGRWGPGAALEQSWPFLFGRRRGDAADPGGFSQTPQPQKTRR